jgi:hypothetical protein
MVASNVTNPVPSRDVARQASSARLWNPAISTARGHGAGCALINGMSTDEIVEQQRPYAGWERETRAFTTAGADRPPRWTDFHDPLDAISDRFRTKPRDEERKDGKPLSGEDRRAFKELDLSIDADRKALRTRYAERLRRFHPDRNGGDRTHEAALGRTIMAYNQLKRSGLF